MTWLAHIFGLDNASGAWYLGWSGVGGDLSELAILAFVYHAARARNCHVGGCWKIGLRKHGDLWLCRRHHPNPDPTHAEILAGPNP